MKQIESPSPNHDARPEGTPIDMLVLHYTGMRTKEEALARLVDPEARVSAHYLIDEAGAVHRLVDETRRAWHAGLAFWRGNRDINARSIGIELVNPGHEFGYRAFPQAQMESLAALAQDILARHPIPPRNVVGHADVAPTRKQDPGELFDWQSLAQAGIGLWPLATSEGNTAHFPARLSHYGYDIDDADAAVMAFQRHFRPRKIDGIADGECADLLDGLLALVQL
ncbi:MAG: N-acetylmuramoyl-L-alanine amidase [Rhodospirillales bacterium]|nr:MAG: N-acetylmuramoyl-L-alanine amidase [Rhodospirillales bacterium]